MSATNAHIGDILRPKQKILILIIAIDMVRLSIKGSIMIAKPAKAQPKTIGTKRDFMAFIFAEMSMSEIIPPSITEAKAKMNEAEAAKLIWARSSPLI